jgi:hypothetical protein
VVAENSQIVEDLQGEEEEPSPEFQQAVDNVLDTGVDATETTSTQQAQQDQKPVPFVRKLNARRLTQLNKIQNAN